MGKGEWVTGRESALRLSPIVSGCAAGLRLPRRGYVSRCLFVVTFVAPLVQYSDLIIENCGGCSGSGCVTSLGMARKSDSGRLG
jgi:hypothetical protein